MHQWTRTEINKALAKGIGIEAETDNARNLPELKPMKSGHSEKSKPPKKKKLTDVKERAYAKSRVTARGGSESGAGKGGYAFSLQDRANGGKARAASMTKKQRQESAKKAVLARWAKTKRTKR